MPRVMDNAREACIGGRSNWKTGDEREKSRFFDNFIGQAGEYVGAIIVDGNPDRYFERRHLINLDRYKGDGGSDLIGDPIDFKTSYMRRSQDPLSYNLLVRPSERHEGWTYVLCLVPSNQETESLDVLVVGGCRDDELPDEPYDGPIACLRGAFLKSARDLKPLSHVLVV